MHDPITIFLIVLGAFALLVIVLVSRVAMYHRRELRLFQRAMEATARGDHAMTLRLLFEAERYWTESTYHESRKSDVAALGRLRAIFEQLELTAGKLNISLPLERAKQTADRLMALKGDRSNFGLDGRMAKWDAAKQLAAESIALKECRAEIRKIAAVAK